jgi:hypothetical protein
MNVEVIKECFINRIKRLSSILFPDQCSVRVLITMIELNAN